MTLKICQLCAVDFTLKHFLTPLIDGMRDQGWSVTAVCSDGPFIGEMRAAGLAIDTIDIRRSFNPLAHAVSLWRLVAYLRRERFDILHVHTPVAALLGRIAGRIAGVPMIVYTAHGFYFHDRMRALPRRIFMLLERMAGMLTDLLFTQSAEDAQTAVAARFAPADRVLAIGNGVEAARFAPEDPARRERMRAALGVAPDAVVIGMIGRMVAEKGYREFLAAAAAIAAARSDLHFVAIGERLPSDHAAGIDAALAAARTALGERLILTGQRADIPDLLAALDLFTLPSYREGMPRTIIEAMMAGLPVVATDIRGSREEVVHGETGLLVPPADADALRQAFEALIDDPERRARMGAAGRARALDLFDEAHVITRQIDAIRLHLPAPLRGRA